MGSIGVIVSTLLVGRWISSVRYVAVLTALGFVHLLGFGILWWSHVRANVLSRS